MPIGRKPIHTKIISEAEFHKLKPWVMTKIEQGQKIFIISPLIEESEAEGFEEIKAVTVLHKEIRAMYDKDITALKQRLPHLQKDNLSFASHETKKIEHIHRHPELVEGSHKSNI